MMMVSCVTKTNGEHNENIYIGGVIERYVFSQRMVCRCATVPRASRSYDRCISSTGWLHRLHGNPGARNQHQPLSKAHLRPGARFCTDQSGNEWKLCGRSEPRGACKVYR